MLIVPTNSAAFEVLGVDAGRLDVAPLDGRLDDLRLLCRQRRRFSGRLSGHGGPMRRRAAGQRRNDGERRQKKYVKATVHSSISSFSSRLVNTT